MLNYLFNKAFLILYYECRIKIIKNIKSIYFLLNIMRSLKEVDSKYTETELKEIISQVPFWWHTIQLSSKIKTPGKYTPELMQWFMKVFPKDLSGKSVLDVGTWDGGFSFEAERRNAREILGIDVFQGHEELRDKPFQICKKILDSKVEFQELDVIDVDKLNRKFDVILFLGVYYHMLNPFLALEKLLSICNKFIFMEGEVLRSKRSICYFLESGEIGGDTSNTFVFSPTFLKNFATKIGFKKVEFMGYVSDQGTIITSDKKIIDEEEKKEDKEIPLRRDRGLFYLWV